MFLKFDYFYNICENHIWKIGKRLYTSQKRKKKIVTKTIAQMVIKLKFVKLIFILELAKSSNVFLKEFENHSKEI